MELTRRGFSVVLGTVTAGCIDGEDNGENGDNGSDDEGNGEDTNNGETTTEFRGHGLPPVPRTESTTWYHDRGDASVYVEPSDEDVEPPAEVEFTLRNGSDEEFGVNPYDWNVYKLHEGDWKIITPRATPEPWQTVQPGESVSETVAFDDEDGQVLVGDGVYGFYLGRRDRGAAFEVTGAELSLEPVEETVTRVERDDGVVTVYTVYYDEIEEYQTPGALIVKRAGGEVPETHDTPSIIREQAAQEEVLRNTLPYFEEGVNEVRLRIPTTHRGELGILLDRGVGEQPVYFVYEGTEYSVSLTEG